MKLQKHAIALGIIIIASSAVNCGKTPLLTDIGTSKLVVMIKGTYESSAPMGWNMPLPGTPQYSRLVQDDSVVHCRDPLDANPNGFLLDIAEIKLADTNGKQYKMSNYRQTFAFGLNNIDPFFSGLGTIVDSDDVPSNIYPVVGIYVRKMLTDSAFSYQGGAAGWAATPMWDVFGEKEYPAFNFNKFQYHSPYDNLRYESMYINRVFPLLIPISDPLTQGLGMYFNIKNEVTVLEIRFVVKNFLKKYEYLNSSSEQFSVAHYYGLSDWLHDVSYNETAIGGNVLTVARSYIVGMTGTITGHNARSHGAHIIAIPRGDDIGRYTIKTSGASTNTNWSLPIPLVPSSRRTINPCNMPRNAGQYTGSSIIQALENNLSVEKYRYEWNMKMMKNEVNLGPPETITHTCTAAEEPGNEGLGLTCCGGFTTPLHTDEYQKEWDSYADDTGSVTIPQLAVFAKEESSDPELHGNFTIENVPPGAYDVYIAQRAPVYGLLYYSYNPVYQPYVDAGGDGTNDFKPYSGNPVTVTIGGCYDKDGNTFLNNVQ